MGFEKQTFLFYFVGAAALLLSILLLPPLCGIYAYIIGLGLSFILTALCNLLYLQKKCPVFEKRMGQVCVHTLLPALITILPVSILGKLCDVLLSQVLSEFLSLALSALMMLLLTATIYILTGLLPIKSFQPWK